jgi:ABC-type molybdate transport system substrate-binding protein
MIILWCFIASLLGLICLLCLTLAVGYRRPSASIMFVVLAASLYAVIEYIDHCVAQQQCIETLER